jgi:hypothetical protein
MDRKARNSVLFGPSIHGGTGSGRPNGIISPAGHTYRHLSRVELEYQPCLGWYDAHLSSTFPASLPQRMSGLVRPVMPTILAVWREVPL